MDGRWHSLSWHVAEQRCCSVGAQVAPSLCNLSLTLMEIFSLVLKTPGASSTQLVVSAEQVVCLYTQSRLYLRLVLTSDTANMTLLPQFDYSLSLFPGRREGERQSEELQENQHHLLAAICKVSQVHFFLCQCAQYLSLRSGEKAFLKSQLYAKNRLYISLLSAI